MHRISRGSTLAVLVTLAATTPMGAQGVRMSIAPAAEHVWWHERVPLPDATLMGLRVGADFGRLIGVTGWYHRRDDLTVRLSETSLRRGGDLLADQATDLEIYGASLDFKLGVGSVVPFLSAGAGVIRFTPAAAPRIEQVHYRYGGGIQFDAARNLRATLRLEDARFRLIPEAFTAEAPDAPTEDPRTVHSNWTASAALGFAIGGPETGRTAGADRWSFASIPLEPFVGRLEFDDDNLPRQTVAGIRAGVDFGNYVGLRGVYWQGRNDNLGERRPIQGYGAEAQFNLNASLGLAPYLVAGAHRIDYQDDFRDAIGGVRDDETALVLGGGIGLRLTDNFRLNVAARDFIRSGKDFDDVASVDELTHNWMLSAGFGFNVGRGRERDRQTEIADHHRDPARTARDAWEDAVRRTRGADPMVDTTRGRMITLPVPTNGELYVRFGDGGGVGSRILGRDSVMTAGLSPAERDALLRAVAAQVDSVLALRLGQVPTPSGALNTPTLGPVPPVVERETAQNQASRRSIHGLAPYLAGFDALVVGVQLDGGPLFGIESLRMVPEFALGLTGDKSLLFAAGGEYRFRPIQLNSGAALQPHGRVSLGLLAGSGDLDSQFGFNVAYGVTLMPQGEEVRSRQPRVFIEHQGIGFFDHNRIAVGLRWQY